MIIVIIMLIGVFCLICLVGGIVQYIKNPKPPDGLSYAEYKQYYQNKEWQLTNTNDYESKLDDIHENERIMLLDETIVKYNKLLDNLNEQYKNTYNESEKAKILAKQVSTLERLNRTLEKREKLD